MTGSSTGQQCTSGHQRTDDVSHGTRGVLHDLGHQLMTLSLLAEAVRADAALTGQARRRMELVEQEMFRAMDMITDHLSASEPGPTASGPDPLDIRDLAGQAAQLAGVAYGATVELLPGRPTILRISPADAWRVLSNLVDNAARSAGPDGRVEISVRQEIDTVIDVLDNGPGFGQGPAGSAGLGLSVVRELLERTDGQLDFTARPGGGTRARVVFSLRREYAMVPACAGTWH
jgi:signal transduction histidine kinase